MNYSQIKNMNIEIYLRWERQRGSVTSSINVVISEKKNVYKKMYIIIIIIIIKWDHEMTPNILNSIWKRYGLIYQCKNKLIRTFNNSEHLNATAGTKNKKIIYYIYGAWKSNFDYVHRASLFCYGIISPPPPPSP